MAETAAIARPYARAAFAVAQAHGEVESWSRLLAFAAAAVRDPTLRAVLDSPRLTRARAAELMERVCADVLTPRGRNFLRLLAERRRLALLPEIAERFERLRAEAEGTVRAEVVSARPLDEAARARLAEALARRLGRRVELETRVDPALLAGAVVRAGDVVIDGSARARLRRLAERLAR
ncbi:MAG TPA: F0F1 ATP synthase subunit delta [Chromatiales bacterium]|nr:F0F1 ATP synthase subunit delta [Chromatiales bacterium]